LNVAILLILLLIVSLDAFSLSVDRLVSSILVNISVILSGIVIAVSSLFVLREKLGQVIRYVYISAGYWRANIRATVRYVLFSIAFHFVSVVRLGFSFVLVGSEIPLADLIAIYCILALGMSVVFTPGNIGVKELSIVFIAGFFFIDSESALNAAIVDRVAGLAVTILIGGPFTLWFLKREKQVYG